MAEIRRLPLYCTALHCTALHPVAESRANARGTSYKSPQCIVAVKQAPENLLAKWTN
jgi:hypothetical protein